MQKTNAYFKSHSKDLEAEEDIDFRSLTSAH